VEVKSLGDHALFLGPTCSKAVPYLLLPPSLTKTKKYEIPSDAKVFLTRSKYDDRVYYKQEESDSGGVEGIMSVGYYVMGGDRPPMWLFPQDI
jgi:hypothetical protein